MSLIVGSVFLYENSTFPDNPPHPKIVVAITREAKILYVYTSTKQANVEYWCKRIEKKTDAKHLITYVPAPTVDCPALDTDSWINCNNAHVADEYVITHHPSYKELTNGVACQELLRRIMVGIISSRKLDDKLKSIVRESLNLNK